MLSGAPAVRADSSHSEAKFASGTGNLIYLAAGTLLPLLEDGKDGEQHTVRTADALLTSTIITEGLKNLTHERRPNGGDYKSFPSGHATAAFAVATMESHYHPNQALLWYTGATLIAASRVTLREHHTHDVIAGAAVGYLTSRWELRNKRGLLLFPLVHGEDQRHASIGLALAKNF